MIGAIVAGLVIFAVGIFMLWVLVYASGLIRPKISTEAGVTGAAAMERKVLLTTGMIIATGLLLTVYGFFDPIRQVTARERQIDVAIERGAHNYATLCYSCHGVDGRGAVVPGTDPPRIAPQLNREQFAQAWQADEDTFDDVYDQVYKTIQRGRPGTPMPAWGQTDGGTLNQEQIHELTAMIVYGTREVKGHPTWQLVQELVDESIAHGAPTPIPVEAAAADVPPELRAGSEVFTRNGCAACHAVQGDARLVGPSLANISQAGATRKPGTSAEDYIRESIRDPSAYIVPTFPGPPSLMPAFGPSQIPDDQLEQLVQYLMSLR